MVLTPASGCSNVDASATFNRRADLRGWRHELGLSRQSLLVLYRGAQDGVIHFQYTSGARELDGEYHLFPPDHQIEGRER